MGKIFTPKLLLAGFIVGTLDITAAMLQFYIKTGKDPLIVPKYVASGVFGSDAMSGVTSMILWGFVFHYFIALCFTIFFFWLCYRWPALLRQRLITGIVYGIFAWSFMRFVVLPLSLTKIPPFNFKNSMIAMLIIIVCIGIPLSVLVNDYRREGAR